MSVKSLVTLASQVQQAQEALGTCSLHSFLDRSAGLWDLRVAERLVKLSLWCCMHDPAARPEMAVVHADMARLLTGLR
jgi:hypothetical protein